MALFWRIWLAISAINLLILAIFVGLATLQFATIQSRLVGERLEVIAGHAAGPFEAAARLGLPLGGVRNASGLLLRIQQTDADISAIHVFAPDGAILHSTDPAPPPRFPPGAIAARSMAAAGSWAGNDRGEPFGGAEIRDTSGRSVGGVLVLYPAAPSVTRIRAMGSELMVSALVILVLATGLGGALIRAGLRREFRGFEALEAAIHGFERDAWRSAAGAPPATPPGGEGIRARLDAAETRYRETGRTLERSAEPTR